MQYNSLYLSKGVYRHRYCDQSKLESPIKSSDFSFQEVKTLSPLIKTVKSRIRWPSAQRKKLQLNNQATFDYLNINQSKWKKQSQTLSLNEKVCDFIRDISTTHSKSSHKRWSSTPQKIIVHNQSLNCSDTLQGFYTVKYIGEHNDQIGVLSKKQSIFQKPKKQLRKDDQTYQYIIDQNYLVNKYIIPRKLGNK